jgi:hypothetical protein
VNLLFNLIFLFQVCDGESSSDCLSDSNGAQSEETCPICLVKFTNQETATPGTCKHRFCAGCLLQWSVVSNCITFEWFQKGIFGKMKISELDGIRQKWRK